MLPSNAIEISVVAGVHPAGPPIQVSRKKMSETPLLSPATRLVASEANTTKGPLALIEGVRLAPSAPVPINAAEIRTVCGVQAAPAPWQVSRRKISSTPVFGPPFRAAPQSLATNATYREPALIAAPLGIDCPADPASDVFSPAGV